MTKSVKPSAANGRVVAPASKSVAQRAVVAALLADGASTLRNLSLCSDTQAALNVAQALGARVERTGGDCLITSRFFANAGSAGRISLFCGESGLLTRMIAPVAALLPQEVEVSGHGSLASRPMDMVEAPLRDLGATVTSTGGRLPLSIRGALSGGVARIDGSLSSQLLTGLLMALPLAPQSSSIYVSNLKSKPYIDLTVELLKSFGVSVAHERYEVFRIGGRQRYTPCTCNVEGDWSGASCLLVAGAIAGSVAVENLNIRSPQADKEILTVLERAGAQVNVESSGGGGQSVVTASQSGLRAFTFDATDCPDLFPAVVTLAACCSGVSAVKGVSRLAHKESNRALTLQKEFGCIGVDIRLRDDEMLIAGGGNITGGKVSSHNDHRIAMALATAALRASGEVTVAQADSVEKSYPAFWEEMERLTAE
ncbi:MAG: 3-phosphoshikimate 1-carboxyvinyltransferase [Prevotellaceae bacterium]|jgi:3-phosphoshikimate 1-carboxyvinyltransferase|nr:3-phosphoshikimate 1-carboxyvinyltransferase [Prevotellaceae bacterium]